MFRFTITCHFYLQYKQRIQYSSVLYESIEGIKYTVYCKTMQGKGGTYVGLPSFSFPVLRPRFDQPDRALYSGVTERLAVPTEHATKAQKYIEILSSWFVWKGVGECVTNYVTNLYIQCWRNVHVPLGIIFRTCVAACAGLSRMDKRCLGWDFRIHMTCPCGNGWNMLKYIEHMLKYVDICLNMLR